MGNYARNNEEFGQHHELTQGRIFLSVAIGAGSMGWDGMGN